MATRFRCYKLYHIHQDREKRCCTGNRFSSRPVLFHNIVSAVSKRSLKARVHMKAVFWLGIMFFMQISCLRFKQSRVSAYLTYLCFGLFWKFFGDF